MHSFVSNSSKSQRDGEDPFVLVTRNGSSIQRSRSVTSAFPSSSLYFFSPSSSASSPSFSPSSSTTSTSSLLLLLLLLDARAFCLARPAHLRHIASENEPVHVQQDRPRVQFHLIHVPCTGKSANTSHFIRKQSDFNAFILSTFIYLSLTSS